MSLANESSMELEKVDTGAELKLPDAMVERLCVPGSPSVPLHLCDGRLVAASGVSDGVTGGGYPIVDGTPILINEEKSIFQIEHFVKAEITTMDLRRKEERVNTPIKKIKYFLNQITPPKSRSVTDFNSQQALDEVLREKPDATVLVIGAGDARFTASGGGNVVYSDVALAPDTHLIADAHDIPFQDATFDAVFAIAVLEHVADPFRTVSEIRRVLKPEGLVYSVTPFMQQVHMGRYDFTRFTALGHRRLFNWFDECRSGVANGPGMVITWGIEYMLSSFSERPFLRRLLRSAARFVAWPFLLADRYLAKKAGSYDCASAYYFFGRLRDTPLHDRDIIAQYKGMN